MHANDLGPTSNRRPTLARPFVLTTFAALLALATPARAHEFWLAASSYAPAPNHPVEIGAVAGTGFHGERKPFSPDRCVRFTGRTSKSLDFARAARIGDVAWVRFAPSDAGGLLAGFESTFTPIELPASEFDAYLALEGLDGPLAERRKTPGRPGRERYRRCAKVWIAGADEKRTTQPLKLPLEIVPLSRPGAGASLGVRVLFEGRPLGNALVKAWRQNLAGADVPTDPQSRDSVAVAWSGRTDARGEVTVPIAAGGEWLVSVVHMTPCRDRKIADWESTWASLVFAR